MAYTKYSLTPANNNAAPPDGAPEGMLPSAVNDTMRDMMAQIRDVGDGIRGGTYTMTAPIITGGSVTGAALSGNTFTNPVITGGSINNTTIGATTAAAGTFSALSDSGNLTFTGTGNRILGDFSNATLVNRVAFQTSTTNGNTGISVLPNGTSTVSTVDVHNNADPTNSAVNQIVVTSADCRYNSNIRGTGTYLPMTFFTGGSERLRIDTSGNCGIGTSSPSFKLEVQSTGGTTSQFERTDGTYVLQLKGSGTTSTGALGMATNDMVMLTNGTERMRIDSSGNLLVGTTSTLLSSRVLNVLSSVTAATFATTGASSGQQVVDVWNKATTGNNSFIAFGTEGSFTERGSITYNRGAGLVAYNITSDYRAKDIISPVLDSGEVIDSVPVYMGKMKDATQARPMFIAHETPDYAHTGEKDAIDKDGNPVYQQMDASSLVPVLWAEVQSLRKRIAALESK